MPFKNPERRKEKHKEYSKNWYEKNRKLVLGRTKARKKKYRKAWLTYKESKSCQHCGASHPAIIDFHHVIREDKVSVTFLVRRARYAAAVKEAENKCIPLCANCHRILHWEETRTTGRKRNNVHRRN